jgi:hypothetical protein
VTQDLLDVTPARTKLSDVEAKVWRAVQTGEVVDLRSGDPEVDRPERGGEWGPHRTVRAEMLSQLLIGGGDAPSPHAKGIRLRGARITGQLDLEAATLRCPLALLDCLIEEVIILDEASALAVRLGGSNLPGLQARQLSTRGDLRFDLGFTTTGEVRLLGAHIGGDVDCTGGTFTNENGPALTADGLSVDQDMACGEGFAARGEVRLPGAHIGGVLICSGGSFTNENGPALTAGGLAVDQDMICGEGFAARGEVLLLGAHIGGQLNCSGGTFTNDNGPALTADGLTVDRHMLCCEGFAASGGVMLTNARVGAYIDDRASWPEVLWLDGFLYDSIADDSSATLTADERLAWVRRNSTGFSPQPYEQLASVYRRAGRDDDARRVSIAKQRARRGRQSTLNVVGKAWSLVLDWTVGYGYRTWQAVLWLIGLLIAGSLIFHVAHDRHQLIATHKGDEQPAFEAAIYTLDVILPVVNLHQRDAWIAHGPVQWLALVFTVTGWILTTAVVLSLSGILKKE